MKTLLAFLHCIPLFVLIQKVEQKNQGEIDAVAELCCTLPMPISPFGAELHRALYVVRKTRRNKLFLLVARCRSGYPNEL